MQLYVEQMLESFRLNKTPIESSPLRRVLDRNCGYGASASNSPPDARNSMLLSITEVICVIVGPC